MSTLSYRKPGLVVVIALWLGLAGCSSTQNEVQGAPVGGEDLAEVVVRDDWNRILEAEGISDGTFVLHQIGTARIEVVNESRASERVSPASTFKILNSMIILETGVLPNADTTVPWDGVDRGSEEWNRDHTLRSGIAVSSVWTYQELARQVGEAQMQQWVASADYGNENIGDSIDSFWLDGDLRISALEQVDFLTRFASDELPFTPETVNAVRDILVQESGPDWSWSYKTGWSVSAEPDIGWLVGTVDDGSSTWAFALSINMEPDGDQLDPSVRQAVARQILESVGVLPAS